MEILSNPRFSAMVMCLAGAIFLITLKGYLRKNMEDALFGFLGLTWIAISIVVFFAFGWVIGTVCLVGSFLFSMIVSPITGLIAEFLGRDSARDRIHPSQIKEGSLINTIF